jgi:hypothetical protein
MQMYLFNRFLSNDSVPVACGGCCAFCIRRQAPAVYSGAASCVSVARYNSVITIICLSWGKIRAGKPSETGIKQVLKLLKLNASNKEKQ